MNNNERFIIVTKTNGNIYTWAAQKGWIFANQMYGNKMDSRFNPTYAIRKAYKYPSFDHAKRAVQRMRNQRLDVLTSNAFPMRYDEAFRKVHSSQPLR